MSPSRPFILRPVATSLLMAAILLAGIVAYFQLPVSALPQVDYPTIQVLTFYPGASPDVTATTVTAPLERQFGQMQGLSQMTSTSSGGVSVVVLQFGLTLPIDVAEEEVQSAINAAQSLLPSNLPSPPIYSKTNPADAPVLTLAITSDTIPLSKVEDLVDTLHDVTLVDSSAIQHNGTQAFVWVIQDGKAQTRNVTTGTTDNNLTQVTGLNPGEVVADSSFEKLQNGSKVNIVQQQGPGQSQSQSQTQGSQQNQNSNGAQQDKSGKGKSGKPQSGSKAH